MMKKQTDSLCFALLQKKRKRVRAQVSSDEESEQEAEEGEDRDKIAREIFLDEEVSLPNMIGINVMKSRRCGKIMMISYNLATVALWHYAICIIFQLAHLWDKLEDIAEITNYLSLFWSMVITAEMS